MLMFTKGKIGVEFPDKATPNKIQSTCVCVVGAEDLSVGHVPLHSLHFRPCGRMKCPNFLSW